MTSKDYLKQIEALDCKIRHKEVQLRELEARIMQAGGVNYGHERVQSSPKGDKIADEVIRMLELEEQINAERAQYFETKERIVNQIHMLSDARYVDVLVKRYVEMKDWDLISDEMNYAPAQVFRLHREALKAFTFVQ